MYNKHIHKFAGILFVLATGLGTIEVAQAASITYVFSVRDSTISTGDNRKTGLTPTFVRASKLSDNTSVSSPSITEVGNGIYKFSYDPEANGEIVWEIDAGSSLVNPSDRYIDGSSVLDSSRIVSGISSSGQVVSASVQGNVTGSVGSISGITFPSNFGTFSINGSGLVTLTAGEHTAISGTDVPTALTAQGYTTARAAKLDNVDVATSTRLATSGYTVPPTVVAIRTEMDANSTKLANLDAAVSTRLATSGYTTPPTVSQIAAVILTNPTQPILTDSSGNVSLSTTTLNAIRDAVWSKIIDGSLTSQDVLVLDAANLVGVGTNSFNATTHINTATRKRQDGATVAYTTQTQYGLTQTTLPATGTSSTITTPLH